MPQENYKGIYGSMTFPPYKYVEFPKSIRDPDDRTVEIGVAQDARDELRILTDRQIKASPEALKDIHPHTEALVAAEAENADLRARLAELEGKFTTLMDQATAAARKSRGE
jgi:hypothetical protein